MPSSSYTYQDCKGHLDGFSHDGDQIQGWAFCTNRQIKIWLHSSNKDAPVAIECNRDRQDLAVYGAPKKCGFELDVARLPNSWLQPSTQLSLSWDPKGQYLLPGLATSFRAPPLLHDASYFQYLDQRGITDNLPKRAQDACKKLKSSGHFYREWYLRQRRNIKAGHTPINLEPELMALCSGPILKTPLNPFHSHSHPEWLKQLWSNPNTESPILEGSSQGLSETLWDASDTSRPEDLRPEWREHMLKTVLDFQTSVSVIIPNWNRVATVLRAIDTALQQTVEPLEILVADDGSEDGSIEAIQNRFPTALHDSRLKILPAKHLGVSATRNRAMETAKGEWFAYLDSDNAWHSDHLLTLLYSALAHPTKPTLLYSGRALFGPRVSNLSIPVTSFDKKKLGSGNFIDLNCLFHHRSLYDKFGGFDTSLQRLVDWELVLRYTQISAKTVVQPVKVCTVDYWRYPSVLKNISSTESWEIAYNQVKDLHQI